MAQTSKSGWRCGWNPAGATNFGRVRFFSIHPLNTGSGKWFRRASGWVIGTSIVHGKMNERREDLLATFVPTVGDNWPQSH